MSGYGWRKWWIAGSVVAFLALIFWLLFYSTYTANLSFVIPLRNLYQNTYWKVEGVFLPKGTISSAPYSIYLVQKDQDVSSYTYKFIGKFLSIDWANGSMSLSGQATDIYTFSIGPYIKDLSINDRQNLERVYKEAGLLVIEWHDTRSLEEILRDHIADPSIPLNKISALKIHINR